MARFEETLEAGELFLRLLIITPHQNPRALMDSDFGFCLEDLWDRVHVDPHEFTGVRALELPDALRNKITSVCHSLTPREPITIFRVIHFPQDYEDSLTAEDKRLLRKALKDFGVWNPYREERRKYGRVNIGHQSVP